MPNPPYVVPSDPSTKRPNYILIVSLFANLSFAITIAILFSKLTATVPKPISPTNTTTTIPTATPEPNISTTFSINPTAPDSPDISFNHSKEWQFLQQTDPSSTNGYNLSYIFVNFDRPHLIGSFETNYDIAFTIALPTTKSNISTLDLFIEDFMSSSYQPENSEAPTKQMSSNPKDTKLIKWTGQHALSGDILTSYFFTIPSSSGNYFIQLYTNPASKQTDQSVSSNNLQLILDSLKLSTN